MISDGNIPLTGQPDIDDLPRTLRREHEARAREARERNSQIMGGPTLASSARPSNDPAFQANDTYDAAASTGEPFPAVVKALDIPFSDLVAFCIKAVLAAIPALLLLMVILWGVGQILETLVPDLLKMKILISFPNS